MPRNKPADAWSLSRIGVAALFIAGASLIGPPALGQGAAAPAQAPPADAQSLKIVEAADAFLATLTAAQKQAVQFAFTDAAQRARWSNFPIGIFARQGVRWGDLNAAQRTSLNDLLGAILSPAGVKMVREQMAADDQLRTNSPASPPGAPPAGAGPGAPRGPGALTFGSDHYYVSFLGTPSATAPWMLQFGGHHLAINATIAGSNVTIAPSLTGGQPTKFTLNGEAIYIVQKEVEQANRLMAALSADQRGKAVLGARTIELVLGPGQDGKVLQPEGLSASEMTDAQKEQLLALIEARLGILNADDLAPKMAAIRQNLARTSFAWYGPADDAGMAYFRVTGPTVLLEFSPQSMGGDPANHLHNMYREPANDYGAAWTPLK